MQEGCDAANKDGLIRAVLDHAEWEWELSVQRAADQAGDGWLDALAVELADWNPLVLISAGCSN